VTGERRPSLRAGAALVGLVLLLLAAMALKGQLLTLPSPPASPGADRFDAGRAAVRLARVLGDERAHPVDSGAGDAVRARLIAEMRAVGLRPRITDDFVCNGRRGQSVTCARVRNLVATVGPREGAHLLLVAHYDSTEAGPGAADDGIGIATMLEVAALLQGQRLRRPVTFLFNEGEEAGLLGARAFLERDPSAAQVDTAVNLEARGVAGPAIMFETSRPNGSAIALFDAAVERPVANSLSTDLYRLIPNSTDVAVFEERPWNILNFAIIGNETRYHSAGDDLAAFDRRSLQHMGEQALQIARTAAVDEPVPAATGERIYADLAGRTLIVLPMTVGLVLLGSVLLFFLFQARRRRALAGPLLAMTAALTGAGAAAFAGHFLIQLLREGDYWRAYPQVTASAVYASALAAAIAALLLLARGAEPRQLRAAFWLLFTGLGAAICAVAPGAAIFFLLPPLVAAGGMAAGAWNGWAERTGALAAAFLLFLSFGPALALFEMLMNDDPQWIFAPLGAAIMLPFLIELRPLLSRLPRPRVIAAAFGLAILAWIAAAVTPAYSADRQQLFTIEYVWDAAAGSGRFAVNNDGAPVPYDARWERAEMPHTTRLRWAAPAPAAPVLAPSATMVAQQPVAGGRRVRLRLAANGAQTVTLLAPAAANLRAAGSGGFLRRLDRGDERGEYRLRCVGRACDGAVFDIVLGTRQPVEFTLIGTRSGLPAVAAPLVQARPEHARAQYGPDATIAVTKVRL
jgi:hypothetical protein